MGLLITYSVVRKGPLLLDGLHQNSNEVYLANRCPAVAVLYELACWGTQLALLYLLASWQRLSQHADDFCTLQSILAQANTKIVKA